MCCTNSIVTILSSSSALAQSHMDNHVETRKILTTTRRGIDAILAFLRRTSMLQLDETALSTYRRLTAWHWSNFSRHILVIQIKSRAWRSSMKFICPCRSTFNLFVDELSNLFGNLPHDFDVLHGRLWVWNHETTVMYLKVSGSCRPLFHDLLRAGQQLNTNKELLIKLNLEYHHE